MDADVASSTVGGVTDAKIQPCGIPKALARLPKEKLVACLAELAAFNDVVRSRVEALVAGADPSKSVSLVRARIAAVRRSTKHHWGSEGAAQYASSLDEILGIIEKAVLPVDAPTALELIAAFIECDSVVFERADDSYGQLGDVFRRACALFGAAAGRVDSARVVPLLERLRADDGYGARGSLLRATVARLDEPARMALIEGCRRQAREPEERGSCAGAVGLKDIADAIGDPELYEEGCNCGPHAGIALYRLHAAQRYLQAGRAEDALARMPERAEECGGYAHEWTSTRIEILRALGRTDELREILWRQFRAAPAKGALDAWLACAPEAERAALLAQAKAEVLLEARDPAQQAQFFLELGEREVAARCVLNHARRFDGRHYYTLKPLAEGLAATHPLAASVLYRALVEGNLRPALSKYYSHGAAYFRALQVLASGIVDWEPLVSHADFVAGLRAEHGRKVAFWSRVDKPAHDR